MLGMTARHAMTLGLVAGWVTISASLPNAMGQFRGGGAGAFRPSRDLFETACYVQVVENLNITEAERVEIENSAMALADVEKKFQEKIKGLDRTEQFHKRVEWMKSTEDLARRRLRVILGDKRELRVYQIRNQLQGLSSFFRSSSLGDMLELKDDQKDKASELRRASYSGMRDMYSKYRDDPEGMKAAMAKNRDEQEEKLRDILTSNQKRKWRELTGDKITFEVEQSPWDKAAAEGWRGGFGGGGFGRGGR